ncbi:telomere repeats-binding bouquet formation protein 2-like [Centruroides vittatus]|uniref:telomere repeats-binding bouquet formation protein 2-like n=1 Tax=Centruroides vittatus TaxID=120091 RepID=UPI00350F3FA0
MNERNSLFDGKTAWFSKSTQPNRINKWTSYGGKITDVYSADFLFSENANCDDTDWIYELYNYKDEELTVFHPAYIDACISENNMLKVNLCYYILPSVEAADEMERQNIGPDFENPKFQTIKLS